MSYTMTEEDGFGTLTTVVEDVELARLLSELPARLPLSWRVIEDEWSDDYRTRTIKQAQILTETRQS